MGGIPIQAMRPHMRMDAQDYAERGVTGGVGMRRSAANTTFRAGSMVGSVVPTDSQALNIGALKVWQCVLL